MAAAVHLSGACPAPFRLTGALAAATVIAAGAVAYERVYTAGFASVTFRYKAASITGTCTSNIHPMLSDAKDDGSAGTRSVTGLPTPVTTAPTTEQILTYTLKGESFVEFELSMSSTGGHTVTLSYVDVCLLAL